MATELLQYEKLGPEKAPKLKIRMYPRRVLEWLLNLSNTKKFKNMGNSFRRQMSLNSCQYTANKWTVLLTTLIISLYT